MIKVHPICKHIAKATRAKAATNPESFRDVKELAKPTQEKLFLKNFPTLQKNKKRNAQPNRQ